MKHDLGPLYAMAAALVCAAASWYLLKELGPLLRPLTLAVFLAYTVLPLERSCAEGPCDRRRTASSPCSLRR